MHGTWHTLDGLSDVDLHDRTTTSKVEVCTELSCSREARHRRVARDDAAKGVFPFAEVSKRVAGYADRWGYVPASGITKGGSVASDTNVSRGCHIHRRADG